MKAFSILILCAGLMHQTVQAQQSQYEYQKAYDYAKKLEKGEDYYNAILKYNIANSMEKPDSNDITQRIDFCAQKLNQLRIDADTAKNRAERAETIAKNQKSEIESLYARLKKMQQKAETAMLDKAIKDHSPGWKGFAKYAVIDTDSDSIRKILNDVDSLDLSYNGLLRIPQELVKCPNLKYINLFGNPDIDWEASESTLKQLKSDVDIYVSVSDSAKIDSAYWLYISGIEILSDNLKHIPHNILQQTQLKSLILDENELEILPQEIGSLTNLTNLSLYKNKIRSLPAEIGNLVNLTHLDLRENSLVELPHEIGKLRNLTEIYLDDNSIKTLPVEIGALENLTTLLLTNNELSTLPEEIGKLKNLSYLNLRENNLITLPTEIGSLTNLRTLSLHGNNLSRLPEGMWKLNNLSFLDLGGNNLNSLSGKLGNLTNLTTLGLRSSGLQTLPEEIGKLTKLSELSLEGNYLTGKKNKLQGVTNLSILYIDVDFAEFNSEEIANMKKLNTLYLYGNDFSNLFKEINELKNLTTLYLIGYNSIPLITIPAEVSGLDNLTALYIVGDSLNTIPAEISGLDNLIKLGLNIKSMSQLPPEIATLTHLKYLDLSDTPIKSSPDELFNLNLASDDFFEIGQKLYTAKNYQQALKSYIRCLEIDSTNAYAYGNIGLCYRMQDNLEEALIYLKKALSYDENNTWCLNQLSYTYAANGNVVKAFEYAEKSNKIKPNKTVWFETGNQLSNIRNRNYEQVLKCYFRCLQIDSTFSYAYGNIGWCYRMQGKLEEALSYLKKSLLFDENNTWCLNQLSYTYAAMNNVAKAFEYAEKSYSIEIDPDVWFETGNQLSNKKNKNYEQALKCYLRSIDIDSTGTNAAAFNVAGLCYSRLGNPRKALEYFNKAYLKTKEQTVIDSTNYSNWYSLSFYCLFVGEITEGIDAAQRSLKLAPKETGAITNLALGYVLNNQFDKAKPLYLEWKDKKFSNDDRFANELFLQDIHDLEDANITHPDFEKVRKLFKE